MKIVFRSKSFRDIEAWASSQFASPAPTRVKRAVLSRRGLSGAPWIETGTYMGSTTKWLASFSPRVISLEPETVLYHDAQRRLAPLRNVTLINASSESGLASAINQAESTRVNFWLDGHFSGGPTFRGDRDSPIGKELQIISAALSSVQLIDVVVFIDDVRLFVARHREDPEVESRPGYPSLDELVHWSRANRLSWTIEHDIFIAFRKAR